MQRVFRWVPDVWYPAFLNTVRITYLGLGLGLVLVFESDVNIRVVD